MEATANANRLTGISNPERSSHQKPFENGFARDPLSFLKKCAHMEGIYLNDQIWTQVEEAIEENLKWKQAAG